MQPPLCAAVSAGMGAPQRVGGGLAARHGAAGTRLNACGNEGRTGVRMCRREDVGKAQGSW
eukprot:scaffold273263_cov10-Tisochrysis_lutea.AAC.1